MTAEANRSVALSSPSRGEDEEDLDEDGNRSNLVARLPSPGMGSEDQKLGEESVSSYDRNTYLDSEGFEAQRLFEMVTDGEAEEVKFGAESCNCEVTDDGSYADIGGDCSGLVSGTRKGEEEEQRGVWGLEVENGQLEFERGGEVGVPTSKLLDSSTDVNGGVGDKISKLVIFGDGASVGNGSSHGESVMGSNGSEEECQGTEEENVDLGVEQSLNVSVSNKEFDLCDLKQAPENGDADNQTEVAVADNEGSCDSMNASGGMISGKREDVEQFWGVLDEARVSDVVRARREKHDDFPSLLQSTMSEGDYLNDGDGDQTLEVEVTSNVTYVNSGRGSGDLDSRGKEAQEEPQAILGAQGEIGHPDLEKTLVVEASKSVTEEEHDEFNGLLPLRMLGEGDLGCSSVFGSGLGERFGYEMFESNQVRNVCEAAAFVVCSGLASDPPLVKMNKDAAKTMNGPCCPENASQDFEGNSMEEKTGTSLCIEAEKVNRGRFSGIKFCPDGEIRKENKFTLETRQSLPLQSAGSQKEHSHCKGNSNRLSAEASIYPPEIVRHRCLASYVEKDDLSPQGPSEEVACNSGFASVDLLHLSSSFEAFSGKPSMPQDFQGSQAITVNRIPLCSNNNNCSPVEAYDEGKVDTQSFPVIVCRRSNPKRAATLRDNLAEGKINQLSRIQDSRRKGKKPVDIDSPPLLSLIKISDKLKRKRSYPGRPPRASAWGPLENLAKVFEQNGKHATFFANKVHNQNRRLKRGRSDVDSKRRVDPCKNGNIPALSANHNASSDQSMFHIMLGLDAADCMPSSDCQVDFGKFNKAETRHKQIVDRSAVGLKSLQQDAQLGDKDIESSLTQEASAELGECAGVSSQIGPQVQVETASDRNLLDPGTSPDSAVYHPGIDVGLVTSEGASSADHPGIGIIDVGAMANEGVTSTNLISEAGRSELDPEPVSEDGLHQDVSASSGSVVISLSVQAVDRNARAGYEKWETNGEVNTQVCGVPEDLSASDKFHAPEILNKTRQSSNCKQKIQGTSRENSKVSSKACKNTTRIGSKCKHFPELSVSDQADLGVLRESMKLPAGLEKWVLPGQDTGNSQSVSSVFCDKSKTHKLTRSSKSGRSKERSNFREAAEQRRENTHGETGKNLQKANNKCSTEMRSQILDASLDASIGMSFFSGTVNPTSILPTQVICEAGSTVVPGDVSSSSMISVGDQLAPNESYSLEQFLLPQVAWVLCDDCGKWRCISVELANALEESNCKWTCNDNTDKAFADCSIPQEKTNAEINAELGIPDEDDPSSGKASANAVEPYKLAESQRSSWISIKSNVFLHRTRKNQTIDEIMVCHCKTPRDGRLGCGEQCLNRILNIECVKGTCPCGDLCSNQQFQKRKYAKFKSFRSGKKGYGLQLQENVSEGQFLIEYVGEVLDFAAYEGRQRYYAARGQKHFYFMTLNGGEVIDACAKGNLGRYINHSCEPNCRTEKWMVNGEVCIGLFAIRDIKKGEEVTFDYNYVRVGGAAVKKCVCGSSECRGYIGGDPLNSEVIVQGDSDEDDFEPVMIHGSGQRELNVFEPVSSRNATKVAKHEEVSAERQDMVVNCPLALPEPENCVKEEDMYETKLEDCVKVGDMYKPVHEGHVKMEDMYKPVHEDCVKVEDMHQPIPESDSIASSVQTLDFTKSENTDTQPLGDSNQKLNHVLATKNICKPIPDSQPTELSLQSSTIMSEVVCYPVTSSKKSATNKVEEKAHAAKSNSPIKFSHLKSTIKKGRSGMKSLEPQKPKTVGPGTSSGHFEGVEGKLNELLDVNGGISKQKDAARGYLKLLFVTAAEGDGGGCASQSTRELSLILDAILKTKSRKVLMDIINKNGLQMLHNILKQNRDNFNRIPIIRKLLKVLEFLALTGILTIEHINRDPPCSGIESFKESMLKLANHKDKQVHKIARDFRDKWIPRNIKRVEPSDRRDGGHSDWQHPCRSWIQSPNASNWPAQAARDTDAIVITAADHLPSASSDELNIPGETSYSQELPNPAPETNDSSPSGTNARKRKSRWDTLSDCTGQEQQSFLCIEDQNVEGGLKFLKCTSSPSEQRTAWLEDPMLLEDEGPPGFEVSEKDHLSQFTSEVAAVMGHPQEIYLSDLPTSFGIPVALMQQLGTPETSGSTNWAIAPGVPFHPFPPLPCYRREQPNPREQRQHIRSAAIPSTSDMVDARCRNSQFNGRVRWHSDARGRRFQFNHPKRWDNQRFERCRPSGPYQRVGRGFRGGLRDGHPNSVVGGNVRDAKWGFCPPDGVNNNDDVVLSEYRQQQNW